MGTAAWERCANRLLPAGLDARADAPSIAHVAAIPLERTSLVGREREIALEYAEAVSAGIWLHALGTSRFAPDRSLIKQRRFPWGSVKSV